MRFNKQKISNHQGLFAFIVLNFLELEFDWAFLEKIRLKRNRSKYELEDISKDYWKSVEFQMALYISSVSKEIQRRLDS